MRRDGEVGVPDVGYKVSLGGGDNVLKLDYSDVAQLCKYIFKH